MIGYPDGDHGRRDPSFWNSVLFGSRSNLRREMDVALVGMGNCARSCAKPRKGYVVVEDFRNSLLVPTFGKLGLAHCCFLIAAAIGRQCNKQPEDVVVAETRPTSIPERP
jgi:hypothetical protein